MFWIDPTTASNFCARYDAWGNVRRHNERRKDYMRNY